MLTHQTRRWKAQKDGIRYMADLSAENSAFEPQDPLEALNYRYAHPVTAQAVISAPLGLPLPGGFLDLDPDGDSVLHDWWSDYGSRQQVEDDRASGLSPGLWPWTMNWYGDISYQDDSNSAASIASPFIQGGDRPWSPRLDYDKETAATPWLPRDYSFSPSSESSFRCPRGATREASSKTARQMKSICPKPILLRPEIDENTNDLTRRSPRKGEPQTRRRSTAADCKDAFLVQSKLAGMSYKQIKEKGQFVEAESTLRGRFRTLTKHKEHRVRKPEWQEGDIRLLGKAVQAVLNDSRTGRLSHLAGSRAGHLVGSSKIPWKQVAEYIWENGGSYHFGNATCRKKWDETRCLRLQERSMGPRRTSC